MRSFFVPLILGFLIGLQDADFAQILQEHKVFFSVFVVLVIVEILLDVSIMIGRIKKIWRKSRKREVYHE